MAGSLWKGIINSYMDRPMDLRTAVRPMICIALAAGVLPAYADMDGNYPKTGSAERWKKAAALANKAIEANEKGNRQRAIVLLKEAVQIYPADASFYYELGYTFEKLKMPKEAEGYLQRSIKLQPAMRNIAELAIVSAQLRNFDAADKLVSEAKQYADTQERKQLLAETAQFVRTERLRR